MNYSMICLKTTAEALKKTFVLLIILSLVLIVKVNSYSEEAQEDFVDLTFTIGSKSYYSKTVKQDLNVAPFIEKGSTMVPFSAIFKELGYEIQWNSTDSSIIAIRGDNAIKLQLNNKIAYINGVMKEMSVSPKVITGTTVVPLAFVSENCGAKIVWDGATKTIHITRVGKLDTGSVMFYEKAKTKSAVTNVYLYDGQEVKLFPIENKEIVNWYSYKGSVLLTMFDKTKNNNNFAIFRNNEFQVLIDDFDIKDTFEFNDNLIIHGYDRSQKINTLYRFDGNELILIADNFYVGKRFIFKDKLVINKYDNSRNYTLLAFDKNSWTPGTISNGFIIQNSIITENVLYMTGVWQSGSKKPFTSYDGNSIYGSSFVVLHPDITIDLNKIAVHNGKLYAIIGGQLKTIENNQLVDVLFPFADVYLKYTVGNLKSFNNELFIAVSSVQFVDYYSKPISKKIEGVTPTLPAVIKFTDVKNSSNLLNKFQLTEFRLENNRLIMLGTDKVENDATLYIYDGNYSLAKALDISGIKNSLSLGDKIFLDVKDKDRITNTARNTMLIYSNNEIKNLVLGMDTKKWSVVGSSLIFAGYESDIKKNKLYSYGDMFNELLSNFEVKYWNMVLEKLFVNGSNPDNNKLSLYKFVDYNMESLRDNIEVIQIIKAKGDYYLVYATERDSSSPFKGKKIIYVYNDSNKSFVEMKVDIEMADMIFMQ
ncbi:MAG: copper amine oxidase N-terminal domain-containing protein [Clostridia bacterium]|nr:copper amine oxidase N-terminal domain-containing protein [Clostridia bacterium]